MPRTTKDNFNERLGQGLSVSSLTQTFQDAIDLTFKLGLEYIWIDSLCIIQGDTDDWIKEGLRMDDVYGGAHLVIAAAHAKDGNGGLYTTRKPLQKIEFQSPTGFMMRAVVTERKGPVDKHDVWKKGEQYWTADDLPLLQRAWVFQERLLSRRTIYFTSSEHIWECRDSIFCECGNLQGKRTSFPQFGPGGTFKTRYQHVVNWGNDIERLNLWHDITAQFSARDITFHKGRLPALASIARQINMVGELGRYICGIWEDTLPQGLLWWSEFKDTTRFPRPDNRIPTHKREKKDCIPSWSWLSVEGRVSTWGRGWKTLVKMTDISYNLAGEDPYGECRESAITLIGQTAPVEIGTSRVPDGSLVVRQGSSEHEYEFLADTQPLEYSEEELSRSQLIALLFAFSGGVLGGRIIGAEKVCLILRREAESTRCKRIGMVEMDGKIFRGAKDEEVVLI